MTAPQPCSLCAAPEASHDDTACSFGWTPPIGPVLLVCGSRDYTDRATIRAWLARFPAGTVVIHGAARGADTIAGEEAFALGFTVRRYPVTEALDGPWPAAGIRRNQRMLASEPDVSRALAFTSALMRGAGAARRPTGTGDMVVRCIEAGVVAIVVPPGRGPR